MLVSAQWPRCSFWTAPVGTSPGFVSSRSSRCKSRTCSRRWPSPPCGSKGPCWRRSLQHWSDQCLDYNPELVMVLGILACLKSNLNCGSRSGSFSIYRRIYCCCQYLSIIVTSFHDDCYGDLITLPRKAGNSCDGAMFMIYKIGGVEFKNKSQMKIVKQCLSAWNPTNSVIGSDFWQISQTQAVKTVKMVSDLRLCEQLQQDYSIIDKMTSASNQDSNQSSSTQPSELRLNRRQQLTD